VSVSAANQLSLIRSFLIDSGLSTLLRETNCAKSFCSAHKRDPIVFARKPMAPIQKICARLRVALFSEARNKSLFHRVFCNFANVRALLFDAAMNCAVTSLCARTSRAQVRRMHALCTAR
jgi:hypothetical protein